MAKQELSNFVWLSVLLSASGCSGALGNDPGETEEGSLTFLGDSQSENTEVTGNGTVGAAKAGAGGGADAESTDGNGVAANGSQTTDLDDVPQDGAPLGAAPQRADDDDSSADGDADSTTANAMAEPLPEPLPAFDATETLECDAASLSLGTSPLRRLSSPEYLLSLQALFPGMQVELPELPTEAPVDSFDNDARALGPSQLHISRWEEISFRYTSQIVSSPGQLEAFLPCSASVADGGDATACGDQLIDDFGLSSHRRPLLDSERSRYQELFAEQLDSIDFEAAVQLTTMAMLQSPAFIYRLEISDGAAATDTPLDSWEIASRLSYFFWQNMPDAALFEAAEQGLLTDPTVLETQARRMLADPRANLAVADFHRQWLSFDRILKEEHQSRTAEVSAAWNADVQQSARTELTRFIDQVVFTDSGTLTDLLTSNQAVINSDLAEIYGVTGPTSRDDWQLTTLPADERAGLLTRVGFLAAHAHASNGSPPLRGVYVMRRLLCLPPNPPPEDADTTTPAAVGEPRTNRELFEERTQPTVCQRCHITIDGFGFGLENYDAVGAYRTTDNGQPVDASVTLIGTDVTGEVNGAIEMSEALAGSAQVAACAVNRWYRYANGRSLEADDQCALQQLTERFAASGGNIQDLMLGLVTSPEFRHRRSE